jgi:membrane associated rhomboid family serine protease
MVQRAGRMAGLIAALCAVMIAVHLLNILLGGALNGFGIQPREPDSALGILFAPWLHNDFAHLGSNLAAFVILAALCLIDGIRHFLKASALIIIVGGALLWMFGRSGVHIGASGWIFGLWALVIAQAWYDRRWRTILIAFIVLIYYGSMALGLLPLQSGVSFEGHVFGAIAGAVAARVLTRRAAIAARPGDRTGALKFWPNGKG